MKRALVIGGVVLSLPALVYGAQTSPGNTWPGGGGGSVAFAADGEDIAGRAVEADDARINEMTISVALDETSWTSGNCVGFAGSAGAEACDQPGMEIAIPAAMTLAGVKVQHRGVTRSATDQCLIEVLEKAPSTTGTGTLVDDVIYGDGGSNDPGDIATETTMDEAIAAGGSIQLRISNYSSNTCTTLNGAILVRLRQG